MLQIDPPPEAPMFPTAEGFRHLAQAAELTSFQAVENWDAAAQAIVSRATGYLNTLESLKQVLLNIEAAAAALHRQKSFLSRMFTSPVHSATIRQRRAEIAQRGSEVSRLVEELEAMIDKTPDSREEQKAMLADLRLMKKELNLRKREVSAAMRDVREGARAATARVDAGLATILDSPSSRRYKRMTIRLEKEAALAPHGTEKKRIEQQILAIDRMIIWLEKIRS